MTRTLCATLRVFIVLATLSACAPVYMRQVARVSWTVPAGDAAVFERTQTIVRTHGYQINESDPTTGRFSFHASHRVRPNEVIVFTIQCYADGHVDLAPSGPRVSPSPGGFEVPTDLWEEYRTLVTEITTQLHPSAALPADGSTTVATVARPRGETIRAQLDLVRPGVEACLAQEHVASFELTLNVSGATGTVRTTTVPDGTTEALTSCVNAAVRAFSLPPFSDAMLPIDITIGAR